MAAARSTEEIITDGDLVLRPDVFEVWSFPCPDSGDILIGRVLLDFSKGREIGQWAVSGSGCIRPLRGLVSKVC